MIAAGGTTSIDIPDGWQSVNCSAVTNVCTAVAPCSAGRYGVKSTDFGTACLACPAGKSSSQGTTTCNPCTKGRYSAREGLECSFCDVGRYQEQFTKPSIECILCPSGFTQINTGESSCVDRGGIKPDNCGDDEYWVPKKANSGKAGCQSCPQGGYCVGPIKKDGIRAMFGWSQCFRTDNGDDKKFARCMFPPACLGGTNPSLLGKYKYKENANGTNSTEVVDPAKCPDPSKCTAKCNEIGYVNGSRLCGQCQAAYSHDGLSGQCKECPEFGENVGIAAAGLLAGVLGLVVLIQLTLSDGGDLDESDGAKSIGISFIQLISLLVTFPIAWPPIFIAIFQVGGAITVLGQHLVNLKCMIPSYTDADVFYGIGLTWGIAPPLLLVACITTWHVVDKFMTCFTVSDLDMKIKASCVALLYLLWPSLCSQTFSLFACRSVCEDDTSFLRADLDEVCWEGRHLHYSLAVGLPMLFGYVMGLPVVAFLHVRKMHQTHQQATTRRRMFGDVEKMNILGGPDHKIYGMFYSAFKEDKWWWEGTVAARKIAIAMIGVFGTEMESMQVHLTSMLVMLIIVVTAHVRPFGETKHGWLLQNLEMFSLIATFLTLWAGSVFNTLPRCEDPTGNAGETMWWCDMLSVIVGLIDIAVVIAFISCFVYLKVKSTSKEAADEQRHGGGGDEVISQMPETLAAGLEGDVEMVGVVGHNMMNPCYNVDM